MSDARNERKDLADMPVVLEGISRGLLPPPVALKRTKNPSMEEMSITVGVPASPSTALLSTAMSPTCRLKACRVPSLIA